MTVSRECQLHLSRYVRKTTTIYLTHGMTWTESQGSRHFERDALRETTDMVGNGSYFSRWRSAVQLHFAPWRAGFQWSIERLLR